MTSFSAQSVGGRRIAVVLAAGNGSRTGLDTPKQFCQLAGHPMVAYSLSAFERHPLVDETAVVVHPDYVSLLHELAARYGWRKLRHVIPGGATRMASSRAAVSAYAAEPAARLLLHDAARPLVSADVVGRLCAALEQHEAAAVALPSVDTLLCVEGGTRVTAVPDRSTLWRAQTPQAFRQSVLQQAHEAAQKGVEPADAGQHVDLHAARGTPVTRQQIDEIQPPQQTHVRMSHRGYGTPAMKGKVSQTGQTELRRNHLGQFHARCGTHVVPKGIVRVERSSASGVQAHGPVVSKPACLHRLAGGGGETEHAQQAAGKKGAIHNVLYRVIWHDGQRPVRAAA